MNVLIEFTILSILVWRISSLFCYEDGPFFVFNKIRYLFGSRCFSIESGNEFSYREHLMIWEGSFNEPYEEKNLTEMARLLSCVWCFSVWVAFAVAIFSGNMVLVWTFALSGGAIIIESMVRK